MAVAEIRFPVMGSTAHVVVNGDRSLLGVARRRLERLERLWSRFVPTSDVSRLNSADGGWVDVSEETVELLTRSAEGRHLTGGRFDPMTLPALVAAGYVASRLDPAARTTGVRPCPAATTDGALPEIQDRRVRLTPGAAFDPGGIGKGLAADLVASGLLGLGAEGTLVNVGGDLRAVGSDGLEAGWSVAIEDPFDEEASIAVLTLSEGAVATTTREHRRWRPGGRPGRHVIDPRLGLPTGSDVVSVTVLAAQAWQAEIVAKQALIDGMDAVIDVIDEAGLAGLAVGEDGRLLVSARLGAFL